MVLEGSPLCNAPQNEDMQNKISRILLDVNKPSRYTGQEIGSKNKNWNSCTIRTAIAFPDLYEIGVSNLGHRILYYLINKEENFLADRVYAPDYDFRQKLIESQIPLFGVESVKPLKDFDVIAFSLQYELSYPTILSMLESGQIPLKNESRSNNDPIIIAGGPGAYNPEPLTSFIDAFIIGDGEDVIIEILKTIEKLKSRNISRDDILKNLSLIEGIYVPKYFQAGMKVRKRINQLTNDIYPVDFPVPYISLVHDRAVIEIRRGCGRMCRFCQSCFVNLPIRERPPEDIIDITDKVLSNTGYDEYSLLSLSSSDYQNIESLVCELNNKHAGSGASISLPSQRADAFSLELANLVQSVRKSTLTFAPEAGSQRLRNAINKNLTEEEILNAVFSAYKAGWNKVKLYFMIGLPTETYEDLDAIINLLKTIKDQSNKLKFELNLRKHLDLTCTVSIFVPKPFTPFQWCNQDRVEIVEDKIRYLRDKVRNLRGVKLHFHDSFLSQLEAVFARGDRKFNDLIERVYKKGSYLDAWDEHFNKEIWYESAKELGIDFNEYASTKLELDSVLPWDFIDTGIDNNWLKEEYRKAMRSAVSVPCDVSCSNCGVCKSFKTAPVKKSEIPAEISQDAAAFSKDQQNTVFKYRLSMQKIGSLKYISHLDWQRMLYRAFRKAKLKLNFSKGFNPSPKISIGIALPLFVESRKEFVDVELTEEMNIDVLQDKLNKVLPENSKVLGIVKISKETPSVDRTAHWAKYSAFPVDSTLLKRINLNCIIQDILKRENIIVEKQKHRGLKKLIDIRPYIYSIELKEENDSYKLEFIIKTGQGGHSNSGVSSNSENSTVNRSEIAENKNSLNELDKIKNNTSTNNGGSLRPDEFLKFLTPEIKWNITREKLLDCNLIELR